MRGVSRLYQGASFGMPFGIASQYGPVPIGGASVGLSSAAVMAQDEIPQPSADIGYDACLRIALFSGDHDAELSYRAIEHLAEAYTRIAEDELRAHPEIPPLHQSGVRYEYTPMVRTRDGRIVPARDRWQCVLTTLQRKLGNCKELATWLAAELRVRRNIAARPALFHKVDEATGRNVYHVITKLPNGQILDPSADLGMGNTFAP